MKKYPNNRPSKIEPSPQDQIQATIQALSKCPRNIKDADLKVFQQQKEHCDNFINNGIVNGMMRMKAQMKMMTLSEYCPSQLEYLNAVISYLETELAKESDNIE